MTMSPVAGGWAKRYVSFSATNRSPTSKVGNMDSDGMKRGSATNLECRDRFEKLYQGQSRGH